MGTEKIREALEAFREKAQGDEPALWEAAMAEVVSLEARVKELERLAYIDAEHQFPDQTWKVRCEEVVADQRRASHGGQS